MVGKVTFGKSNGSENTQRRPDSYSRIYVYARHSRDDTQNPRSSDDQIAKVRVWLAEHGYPEPVGEFKDEGISGEMVSRSGIDQLKDAIRTGQCDMVVVEDVSRLYRNTAALLSLVNLAAASKVRIVAINDALDTSAARNDYLLKLVFSGYHHERHNSDLSERINRGKRSGWEAGYAMGRVIPGYTRRPANEGSQRRAGPFVDEKEEKWGPTIVEAFERARRGSSKKSIAAFLTEAGFPRFANARSKVHNENSITSLITNTIYMGIERYRRVHPEADLRTGKRRTVATPADEIWTREMPHLAFVSATLWEAANKTMASRAPQPKGTDNIMHGIPYTARCLLSGHLRCSICGSKMVGQGLGRRYGDTVQRGYRCSSAIDGKCWNKGICNRERTDRRIIAAVLDTLVSAEGAGGLLAELTAQMTRDGGELGARAAALRAERARVESDRDKYAEAVVVSDNLATFVEKVRRCEKRLSQLEWEIKYVDQQLSSSAKPVKPAEMVEAARSVAKTLTEGRTDEVRQALGGLITPIRVVLFQRQDNRVVVPRARFRVNYVGLLPTQWQALIEHSPIDLKDAGLLSQELDVALYKKEPLPVRYAWRAKELRDQGMKGEGWAKALGITLSSAYHALELAEFMLANGLTDIYKEVTEHPGKIARWGSV
ncbi:MAG: recombinase family protein [Phycisphaerae bacterium]|nr:recombinase family protein [Phycisphaerae bacterium]